MIGWNSVVIALQQLARNKLRTALTSLGILIGVAAVIAMINIGRSATRQVEDDLAQIGENVLYVVPGDPGSRGPPTATRPLKLADVRAIRRSVPGVRVAAAYASRGVLVRRGDATWRTVVQGVDSAWSEAQSWEIAAGRLFSEAEEVGGSPVCLIGETIREELFGSVEPIDESIRVGDVACTVIGRFVPRGQNTFGQDQDDFILMPIVAYQRRIAGNHDVQMILVSGVDGVDTSRLKEDLQVVMRQRRHIRPGMEDDFLIRDMEELFDIFGSISSVLTGLLAAIAAVSLLVGGIGIMNIMTVSVTERTREIGIRLAIGALARDVLLQFLIEAVVLSVVGGAAGVAVGLLISWLAAWLLGLTPVFDPGAVLLAFGVSGLLGVVFGYWPARKAARLSPIDALRHE